MPLGSSLTKVENTQQLMDEDELQSTSTSPYGEEFELVVPTITFFNLSLQPVVYASVQPHANQVVISSDKCILRGSSFIERTKLNERFDFRVKTTLTWNDALSNVGYNGVESVQIDESIQQNQLSEACETTDADCSTINNSCSITASTSIDVDVNVPKPFSSIPKAILQRTGNAAMKLSMKYIQGNFVENLAKDYERWATDAEYRSYRSSLSSDKEGRGFSRFLLAAKREVVSSESIRGEKGAVLRSSLYTSTMGNSSSSQRQHGGGSHLYWCLLLIMAIPPDAGVHGWNIPFFGGDKYSQNGSSGATTSINNVPSENGHHHSLFSTGGLNDAPPSSSTVGETLAAATAVVGGVAGS
eukprot:g5859.t1 g5859   contig20:308625-310144(+)